MAKDRSDTDVSENVPLHPLDMRILLAVMEGPRHGYSIVKRIEAAEGDRYPLYPANLYRRIRDLADRELLRETGAPAGAVGTERPRRYFEVTRLGRAVVRAEAERLEDLARDAWSVLRLT